MVPNAAIGTSSAVTRQTRSYKLTKPRLTRLVTVDRVHDQSTVSTSKSLDDDEIFVSLSPLKSSSCRIEESRLLRASPSDERFIGDVNIYTLEPKCSSIDATIGMPTSEEMSKKSTQVPVDAVMQLQTECAPKNEMQRLSALS